MISHLLRSFFVTIAGVIFPIIETLLGLNRLIIIPVYIYFYLHLRRQNTSNYGIYVELELGIGDLMDLHGEDPLLFRFNLN